MSYQTDFTFCLDTKSKQKITESTTFSNTQASLVLLSLKRAFQG
jgi:hypothetical protein